MEKNNPAYIALKDIKEDLINREVKLYSLTTGIAYEREIWSVFGEYLYNKEQRALNKKLGLHKVNQFGNANAKNKSRK